MKHTQRYALAGLFCCGAIFGALNTSSTFGQNTVAGQIKLTHPKGVKALAFSPDSSEVASVGDDRTVKLWDARTGQLRHSLSGHKGNVEVVAYSPDGALVASGSDDKTVNVWDAKTGSLLRTVSGHGKNITGVYFSPDSTTLASTSHEGTIMLTRVK